MPTAQDDPNTQQILAALESSERRIRNQHRFRWAYLAMATILLALSIYFMASIESLADRFEARMADLEQSVLSEFLAGHVKLVEAQSNLHFGAFFSGVFGLWLFIGTLVGWQGRSSEIIMIACLREVLVSADECEDGTPRESNERDE